ncbi:MAG: oxygenase MpaB family protein [Alcanivorax sp.]|nr:oxygenase MpaB family protein [Alcanivorax sp.]
MTIQSTEKTGSTRHTSEVSSASAPALTAREWDQRFPGVLDGLGILGGGANVIMQLALPGVGYGVLESRVESGQIFRHPIKRTRTTLTYIAVAMIGTAEEKARYRRAVNGAHAQVYSTETSPVKYHALDPSLQLWVAACLYWGIADMQRYLHGEMTQEDAEQLYQLAKPLGTTLQVREDMWPADLAAFQRYWQDGLSALHLDEPVRQYLLDIADLKFLPRPLSWLLGPLNRFITTGFLPVEIRDVMGLPWSDRKQSRFERVIGLLAGINNLLPRVIRQLPYLLMIRDVRRRLRRGKPLV